MNHFVKINNAYVNMDLVQRVYLEAVPKKHYADEPNYGSIVFKPGETIHIRDEESLKRVKDALGIVDTLELKDLVLAAFDALEKEEVPFD